MTNTNPNSKADTFGDQLASIRKALAAGVTAGFAAATPLFIAAIQIESDGGASVTGGEAGGVAGGFVAALVAVGYATWQTANKATAKQKVAAEEKLLADVFPETLPENATSVLPVPAEVEIDQTPAPEGYEPRH